MVTPTKMIWKFPKEQKKKIGQIKQNVLVAVVREHYIFMEDVILNRQLIKLKNKNMEKETNKILANVIVDLYEMRTSSLPPLNERTMDEIENMHQYNFLSVIISNLRNKYKINHEDIIKVTRERSDSKLIEKEVTMEEVLRARSTSPIIDKED